MTAFNLDIFEQGGLNIEKIDIGLDKIRSFNKFFNSGVIPTNGTYGAIEVLKDNGVLEKVSRNGFGFTRKEYWRGDELIKVREKISDSSWNEQLFDNNNTQYMTKTYVKNQGGGLTVESYSLTPGVTVVKNNFTSQIDNLARPVLNKVTDLQLSPGRGSLSSKLRDFSYLPTDERGVKVNSVGKVTISATFVGKATITLTAVESKNYKTASLKRYITVNPAPISISSLKNDVGRKIKISWKKNSTATGYEIQYALNKGVEQNADCIPKNISFSNSNIIASHTVSIIYNKPRNCNYIQNPSTCTK